MRFFFSLIVLLTSFACFAQQKDDHVSDSLAAEGNSLFHRVNVSTTNNAVELNWVTAAVAKDDYFIVERSVNGNPYETVSALSANNQDTAYRLIDNAAANGLVSYRIKYSSKSGKVLYSRAFQANPASMGDFRFYPNPVDKLLIVRSDHPLSVQVVDAYGTVWITKGLDAGMQIVNVSTLPKGNYILKASDKDTNASVSGQLLKN